MTNVPQAAHVCCTNAYTEKRSVHACVMKNTQLTSGERRDDGAREERADDGLLLQTRQGEVLLELQLGPGHDAWETDPGVKRNRVEQCLAANLQEYGGCVNTRVHRDS